MTKNQKKKAYKRAAAATAAEVNVTPWEYSVVNYCSKGITGVIRKGATKSNGKASILGIRRKRYMGGARVYSIQNGWLNAPGWMLNKKLR
jgi:hypothetical protein